MTYKELILISSLLIASTGRVVADDGADVSFDGLVEVKKGVFQRTWIDPDVDFTEYTKILPGGAHFQFRAVKKTAKSTADLSNKREFYISESNQEKLKETVSLVFEEELRKSKHFTVVGEPGPDVMILRGGLLDIISRVPSDMHGGTDIYLSSVGEATLVLELLDSLSGEVIYRAAERRAADGYGGADMIQANTVTTWAEVKRWAGRWATRLREGLDSIHQ